MQNTDTGRRTQTQHITGFIFQYVEDIIFVVFALINIIWSTLYLESWKRRSSEYAYQWGTLDKEDELLVESRPLFSVSSNPSDT